jgi:hypothetical protein
MSYITAGKLQRKRKTLHREYAWIRKPRMGKVNPVFWYVIFVFSAKAMNLHTRPLQMLETYIKKEKITLQRAVCVSNMRL